MSKDNGELFTEEVTKKILGDSDPHLQPRVQRLFLMAYTVHAAELERFSQPAPEQPRVAMHAVDRSAALTDLDTKVLEFDVTGLNEPSHKFINRMAAILQHGVVKYINWELCNSRVSEIQDVDEEPGLRISEDGKSLVTVPAKQQNADIATELTWELALRRRAVAMHVAGLCGFATATRWTEVL